MNFKKIRLFHTIFYITFIFIISCKTAGISIQPAQTRKVLILDLQMPHQIKTSQSIQGWWLGSKDVFEIDNAGRIFSDYLAKYFQAPLFNVYSRTDLKYYILNKREQIKKSFPDLSEEDITLLIERANPVDFGKVLQMDLVIVGRITRCNTFHNRTFHWWRSIAEVEIEIYDVSKGTQLLSLKKLRKKRFYSTSYTLDLLAKNLAKEIAMKLE